MSMRKEFLDVLKEVRIEVGKNPAVVSLRENPRNPNLGSTVNDLIDLQIFEDLLADHIVSLTSKQDSTYSFDASRKVLRHAIFAHFEKLRRPSQEESEAVGLIYRAYSRILDACALKVDD